jgi:hypothetical protein
MNKLATVTIAALTLAVSACAASSSSVPVKGPQEQVLQLAGDWEGSFEGTESGRRGEIRFALTAGRHIASGQVVMFVEEAAQEPLDIEFVEIADGQVTGKIEPYLEPKCDCQVVTEFLGDVVGDYIDGTYVTRGLDRPVEQRGSWTMQRKN